MAITLFPNSQRIDLAEDAGTNNLRSASENYTGIVFDTAKNRFDIVTGKFRDKKDMYNKMTKQDKYLRRAYESRIFDWIQENAQTAIDGYLMLSTAVSKWKNNNVLSKYYKKLLHDLPYINREGRKGDPQTMGIEANFESAEEYNYEDLLDEDYTTANFPDIEAGLMKNLNFDNAGDYRIIISGLDFIGAPVYESGIIGRIDKENNVYNDKDEVIGKLNMLPKGFIVTDETGKTVLTIDTQGRIYDMEGNNIGNRKKSLLFSNKPEKDVIGYISDEFIKDEKASQKLNKDGGVDTQTKYVYLVKNNEGETVGYYQKVNNKVYDKLEGGKVIGTVNPENFEKSNYKVETEGRLDNYKLDNKSIFKNYMFVLKSLQAIYNDSKLRNNYGTYDITLRDYKDNFVNEFELSLEQLNSALAHATEIVSGSKVDTDFDKKNIEPTAMSPEEQAVREREQLNWAQGQKGIDFNTNTDAKGNKSWEVSGNATMDMDALDNMIDKNRVSGQVADDMMNKAEKNQIKKLSKAKKDNEKIINDYLAKENAWKEKRDWVKANGGDATRLRQIAKEYQPSPDEIKKYTDAKAELENINRELTYLNNTIDESNIVPQYVNYGAAAAKAYSDSQASDAGVFQETSTHSELNQALFDGKKLRTDVREALLDIAKAFKEDIKINYEPVDIYFTGSEANYNYNENSDIDVHLVYDFEQAGIVAEMIKQYLQTAKKVFNNNHDIKVKGLPVEVGAEMKDTPLVTSGVYSLLNDAWVIEPENADKEIAEPEEPYYNEIKLRLEDAITSKDLEKIKDSIEFIWGIRKEGLAKEGEFGPSNTLFKKLRNEGVLTALKQAYYDAESTDLSLESLMKEAEFTDKEEANKNIPEDLFAKSEQEIIDGLMDHYEGHEEDAIAKVEDVLKNIDDGYKDKLQNVIKKIKESCSFGNKCRKIVEKILSEDNEKAYSTVIKDTANKIASKYLKNADGDINSALKALDNDENLLDGIEIDDNDRNTIENAGIKANMALSQYAKEIISSVKAVDKMTNDIEFGKSQRHFIPSVDIRNNIKKELALPSKYIGRNFVNFFKDEANVDEYLLGIREQIPLSIFDRPYAFYITTDDGRRIALRGIENTTYPKEVWVEELKSMPVAPTDAIIGHYNGQDVQDLSDKKIGYAEGNAAYTDDGKFLGMIDKHGNVFNPAKTELRNSGVKAYPMSLEEYERLLHSDANKHTLAKAIEADPLSQRVGMDVGRRYDILKARANDVNTAKQQWILKHLDDLQLDHYPSGVRDAIYNRVVKEHEPTDEVLSDYKTAYSKEPLMKVTPEIKAMYGQNESLEEETLTEDSDYYTVNNDFRVMKNKLQDMDIPVLFMKSPIHVKPKDKYGEAEKSIKLQGVLKNPNAGLNIVPFDNDPELKNAEINAENYIISRDNEGRPIIIGYAPQQKLSNYIANGNHLDPRVAFKFTDASRENMIPAGQVLGDDKVQMFKITAVDPETGVRLTKKMGHTPEQPITKAEMFDLLSRDENSLRELVSDIDTKADINADKSRDIINKNDKQSEWITLNNNEIEQVLNMMVQREGQDSKYAKIFNDFVNTKESNKDVAKALRAFDPNFAQSIAYRNGDIKIHVPFLDTDQKPHQFKKSPLEKLLGK